MKKLNGLFAAMMLLAAMSCSNESEEMVSNVLVETDNPVPVRVHVDGFSVTQGEFENPALTRAAQDVADYEGVKAITLAFYNGSTEVYKVTQLRGSLEEGETFGEFQCALPMGSYTMVVVGQGLSTGETPLTLTSPTCRPLPSDLFWRITVCKREASSKMVHTFFGAGSKYKRMFLNVLGLNRAFIFHLRIHPFRYQCTVMRF